MIGSEKFKFEATTRGEKKVIILKGVIDEDTNFERIIKLGGPYIFNFREIVTINSLGIRSWVNFLKELGDTQILYEECPPMIVRQLNMIPSFQGQAQVISIFVPYACGNCEKEHLELMDSEQLVHPEQNLLEGAKCTKCGDGELEFDGHPKQYFAFTQG